MTTIAADAKWGILGADTFVDSGYYVSKIWKCKSGIYGCAGDDPLIVQFENWILRKGTKPEFAPNDAFQALQLTGGALYIWGTAMRREKLIDRCYAIGSGGPYAIGALAAGKTVQEALKIAERYDGGTKGPFEFLSENI